MKEKDLILIKWIPGSQNPVDLFTKNLAEKDLNKHIGAYTVETGATMNSTSLPKGENVGGDLERPVESKSED